MILTSIGAFFWNAHWDKWANIATVASAIITALAVWAAVWALMESKRANQLQVFWNIFNDVQDFEKDFYAGYANAGPQKQRDWALPLFNRIEFVAFLLNTKMLPKRDFLEFYGDFLLQTQNIFVSLATKDEQENPKAYPEFKKLLAQLNKGGYDAR